MEYRSRSVRLDDEVWVAIQRHELSANKLLRLALGLDSDNAPPRRSQCEVCGVRLTSEDLHAGRCSYCKQNLSEYPPVPEVKVKELTYEREE